MKTNLFKHIAVAGALTLSGISAMAADVPDREHRAIWVSAYLTGNWPSSVITASNAASVKSVLVNRMAKFKDQNVNVLYYHVRSNCDAMYKSSYEPWSVKAAGTRGVEPAFDPFEFFIETAHANGIEAYAWINPYRYSQNTSQGSHELNYENCHPDWLIKNSTQTVLNPAKEEVKQRIVDIVKEIVTNYDVDGVIFDDYFYPQGGMPGYNGYGKEEDGEDYQMYLDSKSPLSLNDWRRSHVNDMVHRVNAAIKEIKPYVVFGISPAGVSSPTGIQATYGLPPISGDWQYDCIMSDPLAWLKAGDIDFISPQIYWPNRYDELVEWWKNAAVKFNRHLYPSVDLASLGTTYKTQTFVNQVEKTREVCADGSTGTAFFQYYQYVNSYEKVVDKNRPFGENMQQLCYPTKALTPLRTWEKPATPVFTSNVKVDGKTLTWDEVKGMRYTVYAHSKSENTPFGIDIADLHGISYTNSYALPSDADNYDWFVGCYDRFGNEFSPLGVGATPGASTPANLVYPANAETPAELFYFTWTNKGLGRNTVELARDAAFTDMVAAVSAGGADRISVAAFPTLTPGETYWWRVRTLPVGATETLSEARSFVAPRLMFTAPAADGTDVSITPTITCTKAVDGAEYLLELNKTESMSEANMVFTATSSTPSFTIPAKTLCTGNTYYARITATYDGRSVKTDIIKFSTANRTDYAAPVIVTPAADGDVVHCDDFFEVADWDGMNAITLQISATTSFPTRTSATINLTGFATKDKMAGDVKISSKTLTDGATYYIRARGSYSVVGSNATQYTEYSAPRSFVYSAQAGIADVVADGESAAFIAEGVLVAAPGVAVEVYDTTGALVAAGTTDASGRYTLPELQKALYLVKAGSETLKWSK